MTEKPINKETILNPTEKERGENQEKRILGMKLSELTPKILDEILKIYTDICGGDRTVLPPTPEIIRMIKENQKPN